MKVLDVIVSYDAGVHRFPVLNAFPRDVFDSFLSICRVVEFSSREMIAEQDQFDQNVYFLLSGKVSIWRYKEKIALIENKGDLFCEMVLIEERERSASVIAEERTLCLVFDAILLQEMPSDKRDPILAILYREISKLLAQRLRDMNEELIVLKKELRADL
jgi:CRP/FNR family transcriptional regulator, cyclic AMP receptor protein